jgi:hypothetical protein
MDIDRARLAQYHAANNPALREHQAEKKQTSRADLVAAAVRNANLLEFGHDAGRSGRGAKALLLDVLA